MGTIKNPARKPDSLINAKVKQFAIGSNVITFNSNDSLSYWLKQRNLPKSVNTINRNPVLIDTMVKVENKDLKKINFTDALYVIYKNEKEPSNFDLSGHRINRMSELNDYQISLINLLEPPILFYGNGGVFNTKSFLFQGIWAYEKMADAVPMDYLPPSHFK